MKRIYIPLVTVLYFTSFTAEAGLFDGILGGKKEPGCGPEAPSSFAKLFGKEGFQWPNTLEWRIPASQVEQAQRQVDQDFLRNSYFVIPFNDGEAKRAVEIMKALETPHLKVSDQGWGAELTNENLLPSPEQLKRKGIKRLVTFELPGEKIEDAYRKEGIEVVVIDHHEYTGLKLNRHKDESSLEQLMKHLNWPASKTDIALATNDRSYIPGLKAQNLTEEEIAAVRRYDLLAQGKYPAEIDNNIRAARELIPKLEQVDGVYIVKNSMVNEGVLKQELAIMAKDGVASTFLVRPDKIAFTGNPKVAQMLLSYDFTKHGYPAGAFDQYGGGDKSASMFFGFKPHGTLKGFRDPVPVEVENAIKADMKRVLNGEDPLTVAKNPTLIPGVKPAMDVAKSYDWPKTLEWRIPPAQLSQAKRQVDQDFLNKSYFVLPLNDGEAKRAVEIMTALEAPHLKVSKQAWGAELGKETDLPSPAELKAKGVKRLVAFEMPGKELEEMYAREGIDVVVVDHHKYPGLKLDRYSDQSSLEQLMKHLNWPASKTDMALAVNDRSYIPGLKGLKLSENEIDAIRRYDLLSQGKTEKGIDLEMAEVRKVIPNLPRVDGVYIVDDVAVDEGLLKQELAVRSPDGLVSTYLKNPAKISFTGNPKVAELLLNYDFTKHGYKAGTFDQYGGGDKNASMFFGFKAKEVPVGYDKPIPKEIDDAIRADMKRVLNGEDPLVVAKNPTMAKKSLVADSTSPDSMAKYFGEAPALPAEKINYKIFGENNPGDPLVLIHGLDSAWQTFENVIPELAKKRKVIVYDQRGHGLSPHVGKNYSAETMSGDLKNLLDHLGVEKAQILGHSMGARTAMQFAADNPKRVSALVLEDMEMVKRYDMNDFDAPRIAARSDELQKLFADTHFKTEDDLLKALNNAGYPRSEAESLAQRRARRNPDGSYDLLFRPQVSSLYGAQANAVDLTKAQREYPGKILFLHAEMNKGAVRPEGLKAAEMPNTKIETIKDSGHTIHRTHPDQFIARLDRFLDEASNGVKSTDQAKTVKSPVDPLDVPAEVKAAKMMPRGTAVATSSGELEKEGITQIIHAAPGSMTRQGGDFEPTMHSVIDSVESALDLAKANGHKRVAVPFIGGKIFAERIGVPQKDLARVIVYNAIKKAKDLGLELRFVTFGPEDTQLFKSEVDLYRAGMTTDQLDVVSGSLTDGTLHKATAIVNAANMEVKFGGGLSGIIARATGQADKIDQEAAKQIEEFYSKSARKLANEGTNKGEDMVKVVSAPVKPSEVPSDVRAAKMLPRGSAVVTSSGALEKEGITQIIHAATGAMTRGGGNFDPTLYSIQDSVKSSLALARMNGHKRVAIPFLGGKIFVDRIGIAPQALADAIVEKAIKEANGLEIRFVTFGDADTALFKNAVAKFRGSLTPAQVDVVSGSITDGKIHGASVIVNAANMEAQFGGGLSGAIARATGQEDAINKEAAKQIEAFYK